MKKTGKGRGITLASQFTSTLNHFKGCVANVSEGVQVRPFKPLSGYILPRAEERAQYAAMPSRYAQDEPLLFGKAAR